MNSKPFTATTSGKIHSSGVDRIIERCRNFGVLSTIENMTNFRKEVPNELHNTTKTTVTKSSMSLQYSKRATLYLEKEREELPYLCLCAPLLTLKQQNSINGE